MFFVYLTCFISIGRIPGLFVVQYKDHTWDPGLLHAFFWLFCVKGLTKFLPNIMTNRNVSGCD